MYNPDVILSPIMVSGIIGTTLSLTVFSIFHNSKIYIIWTSPKYLNLVAATFFIVSYFFTINYIFDQVESLLKLSLSLLLVAGGFLFLSILFLFLPGIKGIENQIIETPQLSKFLDEDN